MGQLAENIPNRLIQDPGNHVILENVMKNRLEKIVGGTCIQALTTAHPLKEAR